MPITPVPIPAAPPAPSRSDPATFEERNDAAVEYQFNTLPGAINQQAEATYQNALEGALSASQAQQSASAAEGFAQDAQTAASTAAAAANATKWNSTTLYDEGAVVWSPIDMQAYRRREAGSGGDDPALDEDHIVWVPIAGGGGGGSVRATTYQRTFSEGEERTITLEEPIEGAAIVSAQREVPQLDVQTNAWQTWLASEDFEYEDFARPVALTVGEEVDGMVPVTLASGEWADVDVGRRIEGLGGIAVIQSYVADEATAFLLQAFDDSTVPAGQWAMYGTSVHDGKLMLGTKAGAGYDARDAEYVGQSPALNSINNCLQISDDGLYLFKGPSSTGSNGPFRYSLVSPFDVSNYTNSVQLPGFSATRLAAVFTQNGTKLWGISAASGTLTVEERIMDGPWGMTHTAGITKTATYVAGLGVTLLGGSAWLSKDEKYLYVGLTGSNVIDIHRFELLIPGDLNSLQNATAATRLMGIPSNGNRKMLGGSADGKTIYVALDGGSSIKAVRLPEPHDIANGVLDPEPIQVAPSGSVDGLTFGKNGQKMYSAVGSTVREYDINAAAIPTNETYVSIYKSGIDTEFWTDAHDLAVVEDSGTVYYAVSTDDRTTYYVTNRTDGLRPIARNNGGTWQVNTDADYTGETWVNAAVNDEHKALAEAVTHTANQMTSKSLVLGRSWDLGSIVPGSLVENTALAQSNGTNQQNFRFQYAGDGSRFWTLAATSSGSSSTLSLKEYTPGAPWDVTAGAAVDKSLTVPTATHNYDTNNFCWSDDGQVFLLVSYPSNALGRLQLRRTAQAWRAAGLNAAADEELTQAQLITLMGGATPNIGCLCIAPGGHRMYLADNTNRIHQFDMPTPYSIVGMTHAGSFPFTNAVSTTMRMSFDGRSAFVTQGVNASLVRELSLSTPFDITTATLVATHGTGTPGPWMDFGNDGVYYYVMDAASGQVTATLRRVSMPPGNPPPLPELGNTMNMAIMMRSENDNQGASTKGLSLTYDAHATNQGMTPGVDYTYHQPSPEKVQFKSNVAGNIRVRIV